MIHDQKPKAVKELDEAKMFNLKNQAVSYKDCKKKYQDLGWLPTVFNWFKDEEEEKKE